MTMNERSVEKVKKVAKMAVTTLLIAGGANAITARPVSADGPGYNPPPAVADVCDAGHGAFAAFSIPELHGTPGQPPFFGDAILGSARGGLTGENNSDYSQFCNGH